MLHRGNVLLYGLHQPQAALDSYDRALNYHTDLFEAWRNRGSALLELNHHQAALISYDRALLLNPNDEVAQQGRQLARRSLNLNASSETTTNIAEINQADFDPSLADPSLMDSNQVDASPIDTTAPVIPDWETMSHRAPRHRHYANPSSKLKMKLVIKKSIYSSGNIRSAVTPTMIFIFSHALSPAAMPCSSA
ncbi:MAG: tetratricopeptide repeat protein [Alkalinema sp. RL_2_19]|nr:tetratricopeptide repeat protein [Alkalinema sp. RL_2_19]